MDMIKFENLKVGDNVVIKTNGNFAFGKVEKLNSKTFVVGGRNYRAKKYSWSDEIHSWYHPTGTYSTYSYEAFPNTKTYQDKVKESELYAKELQKKADEKKAADEKQAAEWKAFLATPEGATHTALHENWVGIKHDVDVSTNSIGKFLSHVS